MVPVIYAIVTLGSLATAGWIVVTGQIGDQGLDAVFLVAVCLLFAAMFSVTPVQFIRQGKWKSLSRTTPVKASSPERSSDA